MIIYTSGTPHKYVPLTDFRTIHKIETNFVMQFSQSQDKLVLQSEWKSISCFFSWFEVSLPFLFAVRFSFCLFEGSLAGKQYKKSQQRAFDFLHNTLQR